MAQEVFSGVCLSLSLFLPANEIQQMMRYFGTAQDTTELRQTLWVEYKQLVQFPLIDHT